MTTNLYVGLDWADDHHDAHFTDDSATLHRSLRFANSVEGFNRLHAKIAQLQPDPGRVFVAIEKPQGLIVHSLLQRGYHVLAVNPKSVERYKDRTKLSGAKSDSADAFAMADLLRTDRHLHRELKLKADDYRRLEELCSTLRMITDERTRLGNRLTCALKEYYPHAVKLFSEIDSAINLAFLKRFPNPQEIRQATLEEFTTFLREQSYNRPGRASKLYTQAAAVSPPADPVVAEASEMLVGILVDQIASLQPHRKKLEKLIAAIFDNLPESGDLKGLPGVGDLIGPELASIVGPADTLTERFSSPERLACSAGCAPITRESGKHKTVLFRRACDKSQRRTFYDWAFSSTRWSSWAKAFYDYHKGRGMAQPTILRNLAQKWIRILFHVLLGSSPYDESVHIATLKRHKVVWATGL